MRAITYNAHIATINLDQLVTDLKDGKQNTLLAFIDNMNDEYRIRYIQERVPGLKIVARCWNPNDFRFHENGSDNGWAMSPTSFLNAFGSLGTNGLILNVMNEPHGYTNQANLTRWTVEVIREATSRGIKLCVVNFATGHPASLNGKDMEWSYEFDQILIELSRGDHWLGIHEYLPGIPWRVGRFKQALARCIRLKVKPPKIFISEFGLDSAYDGDPQNAWRTRGHTEQSYFALLLEVYREQYQLYVKSNIIVGIAIFCYGDSGGWGNYRVDNARTFINLINNNWPMEEIVSQTIPAPTTGGVRGKPTEMPGAFVNVRSQPSATSTDVGNLDINELCTYYPDYRTELGWVYVEKDNGIKGWSSLQSGAVKFTAEPVTVPPTPVPPDGLYIPFSSDEINQLANLHTNLAELHRALAAKNDEIAALYQSKV